MARPFVVVDVAAEVADLVRWRVHEAHVAYHHLADAVVLEAAVEGGHGAAVHLVRFAFGDQVLDAFFHGFVARAAAHVGRQAFQHAVADVLHLVRHIHEAVRTARQLCGARLGQEAVGDVIVFRRGIALHGAIRAVVIRHHQAGVGDESGRAAAERHDGAHRVLAQVGQFFCRNFDADPFQFGFQLWQLVWLPLPFVGVCAGERAQQGDW
ncbi:hypothetical protein D3C85_881040 [compost metagenome]